MRAPATLLKAGLTASAALVLLTACGSGDEAPEAAPAATSSSSAPSSSAPSSSASSSAASSSASPSASSSGGSDDPAVRAFCDQAGAALTQVSESLGSQDVAAVAPALEKAVTDLEAVQAPAEISADWDAAKGLFTGLRDAVQGVDLNTAEGQASVQAEATRLQAETSESQTRLDAWTKENCGA